MEGSHIGRCNDRRISLACQPHTAGQSVAVVGVAIGVVRFGNISRARELLRELTERAQRAYVFPFWLAVGRAALGEMDCAFEYLAEAQRYRDPNLLYITVVLREIGLATGLSLRTGTAGDWVGSPGRCRSCLIPRHNKSCSCRRIIPK